MAWIAALAALACPQVARAQPPPGGEPDAAGDETRPISDQDRERARELYKAGDAHYQAGRYEEAVRLFLQTYQLSRHPALLFNIANAYERMGDYEAAAQYLERYLDSSKVEDTGTLRARLRRLRFNAEERRRERGEIDAGKAGAQPAGTAPANGKTSAQVDLRSSGSQADKAPPERPSNWLPYTLIAVGAVALGGGVAAGVVAQNAGDDAAVQCEGNVCPRSVRDDLDRQKNLALAADIGYVTGSVCIGVGAIILWRRAVSSPDEERPEQSALDIRPTFGTSGFGVALDGRF